MAVIVWLRLQCCVLDVTDQYNKNELNAYQGKQPGQTFHDVVNRISIRSEIFRYAYRNNGAILCRDRDNFVEVIDS